MAVRLVSNMLDGDAAVKVIESIKKGIKLWQRHSS